MYWHPWNHSMYIKILYKRLQNFIPLVNSTNNTFHQMELSTSLIIKSLKYVKPPRILDKQKYYRTLSTPTWFHCLFPMGPLANIGINAECLVTKSQENPK